MYDFGNIKKVKYRDETGNLIWMDRKIFPNRWRDRRWTKRKTIKL